MKLRISKLDIKDEMYIIEYEEKKKWKHFLLHPDMKTVFKDISGNLFRYRKKEDATPWLEIIQNLIPKKKADVNKLEESEKA